MSLGNHVDKSKVLIEEEKVTLLDTLQQSETGHIKIEPVDSVRINPCDPLDVKEEDESPIQKVQTEEILENNFLENTEWISTNKDMHSETSPSEEQMRLPQEKKLKCISNL